MGGWRHAARVAAVVVLVGALAAPAVAADEPGGVTTGGQSGETGGAVGIAIGGGSSDSSGGGQATGFTGPPITCSYSTIRGLGFVTRGFRPSEGQVVWRTCYREARRVSGPDHITYSAAVVSPAQSAQSAARAAFARLEVPVPTLAVNPATGITLPNIDTWMWIDDTAQRSESVALGGVSATVTATFAGATFAVADEGSVSCPEGGQPYDMSVSHRDQESACVWRFEGGSRMAKVAVAARWNLRWTSSVGVGGDLADVVQTDALGLEVQALRSVIRNR